MSVTVAGHKVGPVGYGLMGLYHLTLNNSEDQAFAAMHTALANGCNCWNGGVFYGDPDDNNSLTLLNKYYAKYPEDANKVVLNIKGSMSGKLPRIEPNSSPAFIRAEVDKCLKQLGGKGKIDMYEPARRDPKTPLKETLQCLDELVKEGKIGGIALSEVNANTIREAAAITNIAAVEIELSLWQTEPLTNGIAKACHELGIPILAYSPTGKGMLTGQVKSFDDIPEGDFRRSLPRFQPENFSTNLQLVKKLEEYAKQKNCTPAQLALGWLISLSKLPDKPVIIPIPGSSKVERVKENAGAVELTPEEMKEIKDLVEACEVKGDRYPPALMAMTNG